MTIFSLTIDMSDKHFRDHTDHQERAEVRYLLAQTMQIIGRGPIKEGTLRASNGALCGSFEFSPTSLSHEAKANEEVKAVEGAAFMAAQMQGY